MEKLIALAESLAVALWEANANDETAPQSDAFGSIADALVKVLAHIVGSPEEAQRVYDYMIETNESLRACLVAGYDFTPRFSNSWTVTNRDGATIGRIYLNAAGAYSPEPRIDRVLPTRYSMGAALFELVQDYRLNR
jgi:hypothetical protein